MNRLRIKTFLTILPIIIAAVAISGFISFMQSKTALTRVANRHLAYKAEQLRDYLNSEWQIIEDLGLADQEEYKVAQMNSFRSYAYSLLRTDSEQILVMDSSGAVRAQIGGEVAANDRDAPPPVGWFSEKEAGDDRVGIAFRFEQFGWTVAVSESRSVFFSDVDSIFSAHLWILLVSIIIATALSTLYLRYIIGPVERLADTIGRITETGDLSHRAVVEFRDEIGLLAYRFNILVATIETQETNLIKVNEAERQAHETAVQREAETLYLLGRVSDFNDENTGAHLNRIGELSALFSRLIGQDEQAQDLMRNSSPLHDIGKIAIPQAILLKPSKLDDAEFEVIKNHTVLGYELLKDAQSRYLVEGALIALSHHEWWDGSGYPNGLSGTSIPLSGRIVSIVDVFDALTSSRPYKKAWSEKEALDYIVQQREKQFDPELVDLFKSQFPLFVEKLDRTA